VRRTALGIVAAMVLGLAATGGSNAASTLCVGGPHCYSSLQAALGVAQDGDTIALGPGTFSGGVTILHSVTLRGVAAAASKISGGGPVVTIGSTTSAPTVTLEDVTITGGLTTSNPHAPDCGPDVPTCGPGYPDATALGGGIETFQGTTVTIENSVVTGNRAVPAKTTNSVKAICPGGPCPAAFGDAAGIDAWGTMTLLDSTVSDNHSAAPAQSNGGGIDVERDASLTVQGSRVTGNSAAATGPTGRFASGGGIYVDGGGSLVVEDSAIDGNTASTANSLPSPYPFQGGNPDNANANGGGIFLSDGSSGTIDDSTIDGNAVSVNTPFDQAFGANAALCACGGVALDIANTRIEGNALTIVASGSDSGPDGPATLESDGDATTIANSEIDWNTATVSTSGDTGGMIGAVAFFPGDDVQSRVTDSEISHNTITANAPNGAASVLGAGLSNNGPLVVDGTTISSNKGIANGQGGFAQGGGVFNGLFPGGPPITLLLENSRVANNALSGNSAVSLSGGGVYEFADPSVSATLENTLVAHNSPDDCAGVTC
jgi:hypothetical protein